MFLNRLAVFYAISNRMAEPTQTGIVLLSKFFIIFSRISTESEQIFIVYYYIVLLSLFFIHGVVKVNCVVLLLVVKPNTNSACTLKNFSNSTNLTFKIFKMLTLQIPDRNVFSNAMTRFFSLFTKN